MIFVIVILIVIVNGFILFYLTVDILYWQCYTSSGKIMLLGHFYCSLYKFLGFNAHLVVAFVFFLIVFFLFVYFLMIKCSRFKLPIIFLNGESIGHNSLLFNFSSSFFEEKVHCSTVNLTSCISDLIILSLCISNQ